MTTDVERFPLPAGVADAVLNKSQLARALNVSEPTIDRWIGDGLPVLSSGTDSPSLVFLLSKCFAWSSNVKKAAEAHFRALPGTSVPDVRKDAVSKRRISRARRNTEYAFEASREQ